MEYAKAMITPSPIWRPYLFDRVTVCTSDAPPFSFVGIVHAEFRSGPNLCLLAGAAGEITGCSGHYGLQSARYRGFREVETA